MNKKPYFFSDSNLKNNLKSEDRIIIETERKSNLFIEKYPFLVSNSQILEKRN